MKHFASIFAAALLLCGVAYGQDSQRQRLEKHLYTLAADSLNGRGAGTSDGARAASYIAKQWDAMGLKPLWDGDYRMPFTIYGSQKCTNLVALIEGADPVLKDEYIVVGAHYDHLGVKEGQVYNGADDNASGSSCVIEVARQLLARQGQLKRSVIICAFDAEEEGLLGSNALVKKMVEKGLLERVNLMLSVDMVGWYKANGSLLLEGVGTLADGSTLTDPAALGVDIKISPKRFETHLLAATDTEPFAVKGIATLMVWTGKKSPYHKPADDADLIDYEGLDKVTNYVTALTLATSSRATALPSGKVAPKHGGKDSPLRLGMTVGLNSSSLTFPNAAFLSMGYTGFSGGLNLQYRFARMWAIRTGVDYTYTHSRYPDVSDVFNSYYGIEQHSVSVPLMLQFLLGGHSAGVWVGMGGYYGRVLDGGFYGCPATATVPAYKAQPNQWGFIYEFGCWLGSHVTVGFNIMSPFSEFFEPSQVLPKATKQTTSFFIGYNF